MMSSKWKASQPPEHGSKLPRTISDKRGAGKRRSTHYSGNGLRKRTSPVCMMPVNEAGRITDAMHSIEGKRGIAAGTLRHHAADDPMALSTSGTVVCFPRMIKQRISAPKSGHGRTYGLRHGHKLRSSCRKNGPQAPRFPIPWAPFSITDARNNGFAVKARIRALSI